MANIYDDIRNGVADAYPRFDWDDMYNGVDGRIVNVPKYISKMFEEETEDRLECDGDFDFVRVKLCENGYAVYVFSHKYTADELKRLFKNAVIMRYTDRSDSVYNGSEYYVCKWFVEC